jgi:tryptophan-rich sensory protein
MLFGLMLFPLLAIAGYNMWKMKQWAAKLAVAVYLVDSLTTPFFSLLTNTLDEGDVSGLAINILFLVGIASAWKEFQ